MSAAIGNVLEAGSEGMSVRDWLAGMRPEGAPGEFENGDGLGLPPVAAVCRSAVAPLEIAAALEAAGMSHQAVQEATPHRDVFALADELWRVVPHIEAHVEAPPCWRRGNIGDLGRGALYAAPALIVHGFATAIDFRFRWWTLPLAITLGWGMGQLTAFGGYRSRARNDARGEARIATLLLVLAVVATAGCALLAQRLFGGDVQSVLCTTAVTAYMVASAILLMHEEERLAALLLAPAAMASVAVLFAEDRFAGSVAVAAIATSAVATLIAAGRHMGWPVVSRASVSRADLPLAAQHFLHGVLCGLALSVVMIVGTSASELSARAAAMSIPLLVTLGLMEWRLRTFRADVEMLARTLDTIDAFGGKAVRIFVRGFAAYLFGVLAAVAAVTVGLRLAGSPVPVALFVAEIALGALYYLDLTLTSLGRLDVVMRAWGTGILIGGAVLATTVALGIDVLYAGWWSAHAAVWVAVVVLLGAARQIIAAPCAH